MERHLVLAGGGHAHMVTLANLEQITGRGHRVTVIGPSPYHYYSGMGPGMLGGTYLPDVIRFDTRQQVEAHGGVFLQDLVRRVIPDRKTVELDSGRSVSYDVISCNTGSHVSQDIVTKDDGDVYSVKPIERLLEAKNRIQQILAEKKALVAVVGGGPAAAEVAGNIWQLGRDLSGNRLEIKLFSSHGFMARFSPKIRMLTRRILERRGIEILENSPVQQIETGKVTLNSGRSYDPDLIFLATGVKPSPVFQQSGVPIGPDGGLLVNRYLQSPAYPEIFGGGDCIYFAEKPLDKVGVYAVRENPVLYHNLMAALENRPLMPFETGGDYLLIFNLGGGTGVLNKRWITVQGKIAFWIKDYIDRKFMKKFQRIDGTHDRI